MKRDLRETLQQFRPKEIEDLFKKAGLTPQEKKVIRMRYGLRVSDDHSVGGRDVLSQVSESTAQQLRKIEEEALKALTLQKDGSENKGHKRRTRKRKRPRDRESVMKDPGQKCFYRRR